MLSLVNVGRKSLADYASIAARGMMDEIAALAEPLEGKRVLHLSATAFGGGVAEINYTLVPLMADVGMHVEWRIIEGTDGFFDVTKAIHNASPGQSAGPDGGAAGDVPALQCRQCAPADGRLRLRRRPRRAAGRDDRHRPRRRPHAGSGAATSTSRRRTVTSSTSCFRRSRRYDAAIFHLPEYVPADAGLPTSYIWPPAIDPLAPKNMALPPEEAVYIVDQFGIDTSRPLLTQVSRFDPWKDPLGVIDAYRLVKETHPGVQLALVGSMAHDDPEGWDFYNQTVAYAGEDPDIFVLSNLNNVGSVEVNAFQVYSQAVIQKSIREGFGLTVSEGLWKARPDGRRTRRRHRHADRRRRHRLARRFVDRVRERLPRDHGRPAAGARACAAREGARTQALPDASAAPRLAGALQSAVGRRERGHRADDRRSGVT